MSEQKKKKMKDNKSRDDNKDQVNDHINHDTNASSSASASVVVSNDHGEEMFNGFKDSLSSQARGIIYTSLPAKIFEIQSYIDKIETVTSSEIIKEIKQSCFQKEPTTSTTSTVESKKRKNSQDQGVEQQNDGQIVIPNYLHPAITKHLQKLKDETSILTEYCMTLRIWIKTQVPKIEDGNNFGVSVQSEIIGELSRIEEIRAVIFDGFSRSFFNRAKVVSKIIKYPHVEDYWSHLAESDEKTISDIKLCFKDLRDYYLIIYDTVTKNMENIRNPRKNSANSMY